MYRISKKKCLRVSLNGGPVQCRDYTQILKDMGREREAGRGSLWSNLLVHCEDVSLRLV